MRSTVFMNLFLQNAWNERKKRNKRAPQTKQEVQGSEVTALLSVLFAWTTPCHMSRQAVESVYDGDDVTHHIF